MASMHKVENEVLRQAGLELMSRNGKALTRLPSKGRSMLYKMQDGQTVRVRTCNDHVLIAVADSPNPGARLNIEGTDWLLIVLPEVERTAGNVIAYLVPVPEAVAEVRRTHKEWLDTHPRTGGENRTWNLWLRPDGPSLANNYAEKWAHHRLEGAIPVQDATELESVSTGIAAGIKTVVEAARRNIASVAGVEPSAVKISVEFGS